MLSDQLLSKLACPRCKGNLDYQQDRNRLICNRCKLAYEISDDIPVLLIDEAKPLS